MVLHKVSHFSVFAKAKLQQCLITSIPAKGPIQPHGVLQVDKTLKSPFVSTPLPYDNRSVKDMHSALTSQDKWVKKKLMQVPTPFSKNHSWYSRIIQLRLEIAHGSKRRTREREREREDCMPFCLVIFWAKQKCFYLVSNCLFQQLILPNFNLFNNRLQIVLIPSEVSQLHKTC